MPKMMSRYTELARRDVGPEVQAAVPARQPVKGRDVAAGALAGGFGPIAITASAVLLSTVGRLTLKRKSAYEQARLFTIVIAFHPGRATFHRQQWFGRRLGPTIEHATLDGLRYGRRGMAVETVLTLAGDEWHVGGWYERDLRAALRTLGHADALEEV
jgi:hypothetical protein